MTAGALLNWGGTSMIKYWPIMAFMLIQIFMGGWWMSATTLRLDQIDRQIDRLDGKLQTLDDRLDLLRFGGKR